MRFWDTSALVPLVDHERHSAEVGAFLTEDPEVVLWTLTPVEIASAIWRSMRDGRLDEAAAHRAESLASDLVQRAWLIRNTDEVKPLAQRLLRVHALRASDALQLAAALTWSDGVPRDRIFHTFDQRLGNAARREGFHVLPGFAG